MSTLSDLFDELTGVVLQAENDWAWNDCRLGYVEVQIDKETLALFAEWAGLEQRPVMRGNVAEMRRREK